MWVKKVTKIKLSEKGAKKLYEDMQRREEIHERIRAGWSAEEIEALYGVRILHDINQFKYERNKNIWKNKSYKK